jgi:hypothetical protein
MTEAKDLIVIMPLGREAGRSVTLADALASLANEMLAHGSDFWEMMAEDRRLTDPERELYRRSAEYLHKYAAAVGSLCLQVDHNRWKSGEFDDLLTLAVAHSVSLPDWMTKPGSKLS